MGARRDRRALMGVAGAGLALNGVAFGVIAMAFPGVSIFGADAPARPASVAKAAPVASVSAPAPAQLALTQALSGAAGQVAGGGWTGDTPQAAVYGLPFEQVCKLSEPGALSPVFGLGRTFTRQDRTATVRMWAFTAGQGAEAFGRLQDVVGTSCQARGMWRVDLTRSVGVEAFAVGIPVDSGSAMWVVWRRGDVLASVAWSSSGSLASGEVSDFAAGLDTRLSTALSPVCADMNSSRADAARNPLGAVPYSAYTAAQKVMSPVVTGKVVLPTAVAPAAPQASGTAAPTSPQTYDLAQAAQQADPGAIQPPSPLVTTKPVQPSAPSPAPTSQTVQIPVQDKTGPGCGWSFTRSHAPSFDESQAQSQAQQLISQAEQQLVTQAQQVAQQQAAYQQAIPAYQVALIEYQSYLNYQAAVQVATQAQQALLQPAPSPSPSATLSPPALPSGSPSPTGSGSALPSPSGSGSPSPSSSASASPTVKPSPTHQ